MRYDENERVARPERALIHRRIDPNRAIKLLAGVSASLAVLIMVTSALVPASAGGPSGTTIRPPFVGPSHSYTSKGATGCASVRNPVPMNMNLSAGLATFLGDTSAHSCSPFVNLWGSSSSAYLNAELRFSSPFPKIASGTHAAELMANVGFGLNLSVNATGPCPTVTMKHYWGTLTTGNCTAVALLNFWGNDTIVDLTNGSSVLLSSGYGAPFEEEEQQTIDYGCFNAAYGGKCFSGNSSLSTGAPYNMTLQVPLSSSASVEQDWANGTFVGSHHYAYNFDGYIQLSTEVSGWRNADAVSSLDFASRGYGVQWDFITVY
jgi:hypothetical protein